MPSSPYKIHHNNEKQCKMYKYNQTILNFLDMKIMCMSPSRHRTENDLYHEEVQQALPATGDNRDLEEQH